MADQSRTTLPEFDPPWPAGSGPYVVLIDASSQLEGELIHSWLARATADIPDPIDVFKLPPSRRRRPFDSVDPRIDERLLEHDDPLLVPVRVAWLAEKRDGVRRVRARDIVRIGDPRDPNTIRQRSILNRHPRRVRIVVGEPAHRSTIEARWTDPEGRGPADGTTLGEFVALKAWLALERAERHLRGLRYKVPKFLSEDLFWSRPFQRGIQRLAADEQRSEARMSQRTKRYLKEIAAQHSPYVIDIVNGITSQLIRTAHQSVNYSEGELRSVYALGESNPIVFLPSHKSNFDHLVFQHVLYENELPLNHTAGGINMNFFLIGPLLRRAGIFFIRREFKDNEPYKFALRQYLNYLLEKRFALEWYIEGGRSRTGKLREPRLGLLSYVVESYQHGIVDDIVLVPVSINYDQISDVGSYTVEQRGGTKERESFVWVIKFIASLRRRHGSIHLRFGEPLTLSSRIGRDDDLQSEEGRLALPKVAFEISNRINDVTPITAISLVTLALLSGGGRGFTVDETRRVLTPFFDFVDERNLPTTFDASILSTDAVQSALEALVINGVVTRTDGLTEVVYTIGEDQRLAAAYYRNTVIHFFITAGITELALVVGAIRDLPMDTESVVDRAIELRDLLKFEFFFPEKKIFAEEVRSEIDRYRSPEATADDAVELDMEALHPAKSPIVLRPFLEASYVVASALSTFGDEAVDKKTLADASLAMGNQLLRRGTIHNSEAVSTSLFLSGIALVHNRGLDDASTAERKAFLESFEDVLRALDAISEG